MRRATRPRNSPRNSARNSAQFSDAPAAGSRYADHPYHNFRHCCDVSQCVHYFTKQRQGAAAALRTLDVFALLLAAICHDVDHVGLTADFLGGTALDLLYNERSPMESHHLTTTFRILGHPKCNVLAGVAQADRKALRSSVVACVLGTDMSRHAQFPPISRRRASCRSSRPPTTSVSC